MVLPVRHLPAEWSPQKAILLTWPHGDTDWAPQLERVTGVFATLAREISKRQRLIIACHDEGQRTEITERLRQGGSEMDRIALHIAPSNDSWARDHGPITVFEGQRPILLDFQFNGWGRKHPFRLDNQISKLLHQQGAFGSIPMERQRLILEGGSIDSDGHGSLLTTRHCLLSPQRNPGHDCIGYEGAFAQLFNTQRVLWLDHGELEGDDTDGHIDTLARFCDPNTIAYVSCSDSNDSHYQELTRMKRELGELIDYQGNPYRLIPLPFPDAIFSPKGDRLPASYANFAIINSAVLIPTYGAPQDQAAIEVLGECFPDREIIPIDSRPLIEQRGSLHCLVMQIPKPC